MEQQLQTLSDPAAVILSQILDELKTGNADKRLWSMDDIGNYLGLSASTVQTRIVCKPDFPKAISIPTGTGHTNRRWYPNEVKDWIGRHRENKTIKRGRKRNDA